MKRQYLTALAILLTSCVQSIKAPSSLSEKDYYKMMYEQASANAASATTVTYWALSSLVGIFSIIIVLQFLFNIRINKQKLAEVESRINIDIQKQIIITQTNLLTAISTNEATNRQLAQNRFTELSRQLTENINRELDIRNKILTDKVDLIASELHEFKKEYLQSMSGFDLQQGNINKAFKNYIQLAASALSDENFDNKIFEIGLPIVQKMQVIDKADFDKLKNYFSIYHKNAGQDHYGIILWRAALKKLEIHITNEHGFVGFAENDFSN